MSVAHGLARSVQRAFAAGSFLRAPLLTALDDSSGRKEWLHFAVATRELDLVVNFSFGDDCRPAARSNSRVARLVCVARTKAWEGDVDGFDTRDVHVGMDDVHLRFGESSVDSEGGALHVRARLRQRPLEVDLTFRPRALPTLVSNIELSGGPPWHWFVAPRMTVNGTVTVAGRALELCDAPGYHDHNWGHFLWGEDFAWTWGYGHAGEWSFTCNTISNRAGTVDLGRGLLLWRGVRQHRVFSGRSIRLQDDGFLPPRPTLTVPRALSLLAPGTALDLPATLRGEARAGSDVLAFEFEPSNVCRVLIPNETQRGVTTLNEVTGRITLDGHCHSSRVRGEGTGTFEFLHG